MNGKVSENVPPGQPYRKVAALELGVNPLAIDESVRFGRIPNVGRAIGTCLDSAPQLRELHKMRKSNPNKVQTLIAQAARGEKVTAIETNTAAEEFAAWILKHATREEIPIIITWIHKVSAKCVGPALRRLVAQREPDFLT